MPFLLFFYLRADAYAPTPRGVYRLWGIARGPQNLINQCFGYHIRDQRGRFTPGWSLLQEFF